jgi:hypothetical protein
VELRLTLAQVPKEIRHKATDTAAWTQMAMVGAMKTMHCLTSRINGWTKTVTAMETTQLALSQTHALALPAILPWTDLVARTMMATVCPT